MQKPQITLKGCLLTLLGWSIYAFLYTLMVRASDPVDFLPVFAAQLFHAYVLAVITVIPWWIAVRELDKSHWGWKLLVHMVMAPLSAWIAIELFLYYITVVTTDEVHREISLVYYYVMGSGITIYSVQFFLFHGYRIIERLRIKEKQAAELQALAKESELIALKAQINPHFLFNTLNSMNAMVIQKPAEVREMIVQLGDLLRYALDSSEKKWVSLQDELTFSQDYLDLEKYRFESRMEVVLDIDPSVDTAGIQVPPMVLQPLVENAIKHNISRRIDGGQIHIRVFPEADGVRVEVKDLGNGESLKIPVNSSSGIGLANTDSRLEKSLGEKSRLTTQNLDSKGFLVSFWVPVFNG